MLNQVVLVGRLAKDVEIKELENNKKNAILTLAVPRSYKNEEGIYETDFIDCSLWDSIAQNTKEYCKKGDIIGIKGRVQTTEYNGERYTQLVAEKVTFLSSKKEDNE